MKDADGADDPSIGITNKPQKTHTERKSHKQQTSHKRDGSSKPRKTQVEQAIENIDRVNYGKNRRNGQGINSRQAIEYRKYYWNRQSRYKQQTNLKRCRWSKSRKT